MSLIPSLSSNASFSVQSPIGMLTYFPQLEMFATPAYASMAGNFYFEGVLFSKHIVVRVGLGIGHSRDFVNSVRIYAADSGVLIAQGNYHCDFYSSANVRGKVSDLLRNKMLEANQLRRLGKPYEEVARLASDLTVDAFRTDQRNILETQRVPLLFG